MSASLANANLGLNDNARRLLPIAAPQIPSPGPSVSGFEALQALLAFSSMHEQIRQRQALGLRRKERLAAEEGWDQEQFVLDEVLQLVAERALAITGADGVAIALAEGNDIICRASAGQIAPDAGARLDPNSGFSGACFRTGLVVRSDDTESDTRVNLQVSRRLGARSLVAVPLAGQQTVIGLLEAFSYDAYAFNDSDVSSLNLLAELIVAAMKPEEEDRLAQISQNVVARAAWPLGPRASWDPALPAESHVPDEDPDNDATAWNVRPAILADYKQGSRPGLVVVLGIVLFAVVLGAGVWWNILHNARHLMATAQASTPPSTSQAPEDPVQPPADVINSESAIQEKLAVLPRVTGIRHWSSADSSTVVVDMQDQVQYEAHRLSDPERIYVDLHDTALAPGLFGKLIEVGDALLMRVRMAQPMPGITRVVLETKGGSNFSVSMEPDPYRLVIQVRGIHTTIEPQAKIDLFAPMTPSEGKRLASANESRDDQAIRAQVPKFRIVLDAGHGGWDLGTVGRQGLLEKDLVLDVVERLGNLIENRLGSEVIYTRQDDDYIALEQRAEIANQSQADLFLSVHANYSDYPSARGVETYYTNTFSSVHAHGREAGASLQGVSFANIDIREKVEESHRFAASVQRALYGTLASKNPGIRDRGVKAASYVVLTGTSMPAILAEVSFVSSPTDEQNLQSSAYRQQIAEALYKGVARYAAGAHKVKIASTSGKPSGR